MAENNIVIRMFPNRNPPVTPKPEEVKPEPVKEVVAPKPRKKVKTEEV